MHVVVRIPPATPAPAPLSRASQLSFPLPTLRLALAAGIHALFVDDAELRDQLRRASKSAFLNVAEGLPANRSPLKRRYFTSAIGSLCEVQAALDLGGAIGVIASDEVARLQRLAVRVVNMAHRLNR